jgi:choline dehydrogenase-like flavoprotein
MVTERFFPIDFQPRANFTDPGHSTIPEAWPITFEELVPWYEKAEVLFHVHGSADPLRPASEAAELIPPPPMIPANVEVTDFLKSRGLHPYNLHVACEYKPECRACQSHLCANGCKNEAGRNCVLPAIRDHGAVLIDHCTVKEIEATRTRVTGVKATWKGESVKLEGRVLIVATGALTTPVLLLNSKSADWPTGLANEHDLVGRNFMRHFVDMYIFRSRATVGGVGQIKEIGLNDFYAPDGKKWGTIQSVGHVPPYVLLMNGDRKARKDLGRIRRWVEPIYKSWIQDHFVLLAAIAEDLPYLENRILPGPASQGGSGPFLKLEYRMFDNDWRRLREFQKTVKKRFGKWPGSWIYPFHVQASHENTALGHQCGTCRFGDDPKTSVLDRDNRAWGLDNLYVVDASFVPSSAGINPSLTIAANALRVAHRVHERL